MSEKVKRILDIIHSFDNLDKEVLRSIADKADTEQDEVHTTELVKENIEKSTVILGTIIPLVSIIRIAIGAGDPNKTMRTMIVEVLVRELCGALTPVETAGVLSSVIARVLQPRQVPVPMILRFSDYEDDKNDNSLVI